MRVAGIIAEYNPLHNGHVHHIAQARAMTNADYVIVVMSGNYVQRGEPAVADKFTRAEWALHAGADLVLELPTVCALSSAERFAYGGVRVLAGTGVLTHLCFGSEHTALSSLLLAADTLAEETPQFKHKLREQLSIGKSYPRARYDALLALGTDQCMLDILRAPNSILGVEYIRFLKQYAPHVQPVAIERVGNQYHDQALTGAFSSATAIREALRNSDPLAYDSMPMYVAGRFSLGARPVCLKDAELLMLYALKRMDAKDLVKLPDITEGFENVIARAAQKVISMDALFAELKSKRYTMARIKRIAMSAMLGIQKEHIRLLRSDNALSLRVLGFRHSARSLISAIQKKRTLPLVMRRADFKNCSQEAYSLLEIDRMAHEIYALFTVPEQPSPDYSHPPIIL